MAIKRRGR
ncbi:hypothetical protein HU200_066026 [Digitaria exilis]|uniref:Uncharacterized protein n=1 Tax=Digitaria exilis TaxID=1010633 RepID=A0A835DXE7_9POAL|nr:hypothetical protein HU200_066026 [Digitaria exilis]